MAVAVGRPSAQRAASGATAGAALAHTARDSAGRASAADAFADGVADFLADGLTHLRSHLRALDERAEMGPSVHAVLDRAYTEHARRRLLEASLRTFVLELNVARLRGQLTGDTPEARFAHYVGMLRDAAYRERLFAEYATLARLLAATATVIADAMGEFAARLAADYSSLRALAGSGSVPLGMLAAVTMAGDPHRQGRCVMIATFANGRRVVYKPRSLAPEMAYSACIDWLNARGQRPALRAPALLDRGAYGWMEFVAPSACGSHDEVRRFHARQGAHLALLYALDATDLHLENVIACGEFPCLVDLEALCQPRFRRARAWRAADDVIASSVLRVGLLPSGGEGACGGGVDRSGLGGADDQRSEVSALGFAGTGTDTMRAVETFPTLPTATNVAMIDGQAVSPWRFASDVSAGFATTYRRLLAGRDELLADGGPLAALSGAHVRVLARPTALYGTLLTQSRHPNALRTDADRDRVLDRLARAVDAAPHLERLIASERADLERGDVPIFTVRFESAALSDSAAREIPDAMEASPLTTVRARIAALGHRDLGRQLAFIRGAMSTAAPAALMAGPPQSVLPAGDAAHFSIASQRWSRQLARRLVATAIDEDGTPAWIAASPGVGGHWTLAPVSDSLYDGRAGIALFLGYEAAVSGNRAAAEAARRVADSLAIAASEWSSASEGSIRGIGAFTGAAGVVYTFAHLGYLWGDANLLDRAESLATRIAVNVESDAVHDVIGGAAGALKCILALHACRATPALLAAATQCGDALLARAVRLPVGTGWPGSQAEAPLIGYSHGASGIAVSLLALAAVIPDQQRSARYRAVAMEAFEYERSLYDATANAWPDLRAASGGSSSFAAWCHGAPGIALARIEARRYLDDPRLVTERDAALSTTMLTGYSRSHSLCHGVAGNLDIVWQASQAADATWQPHARTLARRLSASLQRHDVVCGTPNGVATPGLMTGIAGVAYGQLRLAVPQLVPSVLALEPPRCAVQ